MKAQENKSIKYFHIKHSDELWGIVVTTVGYQFIPPHTPYPPLQHPESHHFIPPKGRTLKEFVLLYISQGSGYFESQHCKKQKVEVGSMILLFPNEWHTYEPELENGWAEYWVGFKGEYIEKQVENGFFSPQRPIFHLKFNSSIISLYEDIINYASLEKIAYQQIIAGIVFHLLGFVYYKHKNTVLSDTFTISKINEARIIMKQEIDNKVSPESIAECIGVGYSWFRKMFKQYTGVSPAQYQSNLKFLRSKELLTTTEMSITEIAYLLNFENTSQFSTFFRKKAGLPPLQYRKEGKAVTRNAI